MMSLQLALAMECPVCGVNNTTEPVSDGHSVALFGVAKVEQLLEQGICPRCLRTHAPWTPEQQNRLAAWIVAQLKERLFKTCSCCQRTFTQTEWEALPSIGVQTSEDDEATYACDLRNCSCGTTLGHETSQPKRAP